MLKRISNFRSGAGFTLIELIIVTAILVAIASLVLITVNPLAQVQKANDGKRKSDLAQIQRALESFYQDNGRYPDNNSDYQIFYVKNGNTITITPGSSWSPYMNAFPSDPSSSKKYIYKSSTGNQSYWIYASLDRAGKDPQACNKGDACSSLWNNSISTIVCGGVCNYGVSSPDVKP